MTKYTYNDNMLTLGHIIYSNCFPPHAGIVTGRTPFPFKLVEGIPSQLNRMLDQGAIDVSPSSSIEYAKHIGQYLLLPGLSITSKKEVKSIILQSRVPMNELEGRTVKLTTASATSVVLLRVLLEHHLGVHPSYTTFEQGVDDPYGTADAMLFIGDLALKTRPTDEYPHRFDLGAVWHEHTGLPFVFALWQVHYKKNIDADLKVLYDILEQSKSYGLTDLPALAQEHANRFGLSAETLIEYWRSFSYDLGDDEQRGLLAFYGYAADLGVIKPVTELRFWNKS
jgi:chorismate dehydratase